MRLVTFNRPDADPRVGALVEGDRSVVDLRLAAERSSRPTQVFQTMLALIDGGERALDDARALLDWAVRAGIDDAIVPRAQVVLLAPVPVPRQMRDFLSFEQHLRTAREMRFRKMAAREADPASAFADYVRRGVVLPPDVWYAQPIYYKCNRFSVIGTDADIRWPGYANVLDYELEFGVFIGRGGVNSLPKRLATVYLGTRSSTTSVRATRRPAKWRVSSARPRAAPPKPIAARRPDHRPRSKGGERALQVVQAGLGMPHANRLNGGGSFRRG